MAVAGVIQQMETNDALTVAEFAKRSGLSLQYIYGLLRSGRLQAQKSDGQWAIDPSELQRRTQSQQAAVSQ
jgi:excisionase family DNA binding protein